MKPSTNPDGGAARASGRGRRGAFTLVEVLVALAIASVTIAAGAVVMGQAFRAFSAVSGLSRRMEDDTRRLDAFELLRADLASALPAPATGAAAQSAKCEFSGDGTGFSCLRLASTDMTETGYRIFRITWESDGAGGCIRRATPVAPPPAPEGASGACAPIARFPASWGAPSFEWAARPESGRGGDAPSDGAAATAIPPKETQWADSWTDGNELPAAAKVRWGNIETVFALRASCAQSEGDGP